MAVDVGMPRIGRFHLWVQVVGALVLTMGASVPRQSDLALSLIQAGARIQRGNQKNVDPEPPRMFVAEGCDGSSATIRHAINILALHGIDAGDDNKQLELLDTTAKRNPYYDPSNPAMTMGYAMKRLQKEARSRNQTLVFKSILHRDMKMTVSHFLTDMGTKAVYATRRNTLDRLVCMVRDCFYNTNQNTTTKGYPVDTSGKPTDVCFQRRTEGNHETDRAMLKIWGRNNQSLLKENLETLHRDQIEGMKALREAGYNFQPLFYEDLVAFESGGKANLETSLKQWQKLLNYWGVHSVDTDALTKYLKSEQGDWHQSSQAASIYNLKEVTDELKRLGKTDQLRD